ncbi:MAG: hypothetical protein ACI845_004052 [Gammaproteobacteria bacterium]|jgi:hypothetical protein
MHPVEHMLYISSLLIHLVAPSHPVHMLFHAYWLTLATATSHSGYEALVLKGNSRVTIANFFINYTIDISPVTMAMLNCQWTDGLVPSMMARLPKQNDCSIRVGNNRMKVTRMNFISIFN